MKSESEHLLSLAAVKRGWMQDTIETLQHEIMVHKQTIKVLSERLDLMKSDGFYKHVGEWERDANRYQKLKKLGHLEVAELFRKATFPQVNLGELIDKL